MSNIAKRKKDKFFFLTKEQSHKNMIEERKQSRKKKKEIERQEEIKKRIDNMPKFLFKKDQSFVVKFIKKYPIEVQRNYIKRYQDYIKKNGTLKERNEKVLTELDNKETFFEGERSNKDKSKKLSDYQKAYIIELSGRFYRPSQIMKVINEEFGIKEYNPRTLTRFLKNNAEIIRSKRLKYTSDVSSIRYAHQRPRLEELSLMFEKAKDEEDKKIMLDVLKEIRQSVEGDKLSVVGNITNNINLNIKNHLFSEYDVENFAKLAMLKILEKHNINFLSIAHRLKKETKLIQSTIDPKIKEEKIFPIAVDGVSVLSNKKVNDKLKKEEENVINNVDNIRKLLKKGLERKIKDSDSLIKDVEFKEVKDDYSEDKIFTKKKSRKKK